jgi:hypothetical protein
MKHTLLIAALLALGLAGCQKSEEAMPETPALPGPAPEAMPPEPGPMPEAPMPEAVPPEGAPPAQ